METESRELLRALRGGRSQVAWARRLGYRGNPITDWENGRSYPTAEEALRAASRAGIDVAAAFTRFDQNVPIQATDDGPDTFDVARWVRGLCAGKRITDLAGAMGRSRSSVSRWLSGDAKPRLPDFLRIVEAATGRTHDLVAQLVPIEQVPSLRDRFEAAQAAKRLAFDAPWTEAIVRVLETAEYRDLPCHDAAWLAARLSLPVTECVAGIERLLESRVVRFEGEHLVVESPITVDTRGGKAALRALKKHWALVAADRATRPRDGDVFAYNVLSASEADLQRIRDVLTSAYREIRAIVAASEPSERVALLNVQLMSWGPDEPADARDPLRNR